MSVAPSPIQIDDESQIPQDPERSTPEESMFPPIKGASPPPQKISKLEPALNEEKAPEREMVQIQEADI